MRWRNERRVMRVGNNFVFRKDNTFLQPAPLKKLQINLVSLPGLVWLVLPRGGSRNFSRGSGCGATGRRGFGGYFWRLKRKITHFGNILTIFSGFTTKTPSKRTFRTTFYSASLSRGGVWTSWIRICYSKLHKVWGYWERGKTSRTSSLFTSQGLGRSKRANNGLRLARERLRSKAIKDGSVVD